MFYSLVDEIQFERRRLAMVPLREGFFNPELIYVPGLFSNN